ncbi:SAV_915 family protein [Nocardioides pantholopis]|uniref:SAV_915 family protein n=1 Tax=Nocardioides pantholopis TaxID=2483798 RepID=UPI000FD78F1B|nr:SAV_915 family protein [Nocardioides pantholopis]
MNGSQHRDTVFVPVRLNGSGATTLVLCRRPDGVRTGLAFGSAAALEHALGVGQPHLALSLSGLRAMLADLGVYAVQVDPEAVLRPPAPCRAAS